MTVLVSLLALVIERFFDWSHLRHWRWFTYYRHYLLNKMPGQPDFVILAVIILPATCLVFFVQWLTQAWLYGLFGLMYQLFVLVYCLGPQNFWADAFACINALACGDAVLAKDKLKAAFAIQAAAPMETSYTQSLHRHFLRMIFIESNRRVFAVVVWYVLLGPAGAVLYRMVTLSAVDGLTPIEHRLNRAATLTEAILNWLPVRLLTVFFALAGHFVQVVAQCRKSRFWTLENETFLSDCGAAAIGYDQAEALPSDCFAEKSAVSLIDRACLLLLLVIAIIYFVF